MNWRSKRLFAGIPPANPQELTLQWVSGVRPPFGGCYVDAYIPRASGGTGGGNFRPAAASGTDHPEEAIAIAKVAEARANANIADFPNWRVLTPIQCCSVAP